MCLKVIYVKNTNLQVTPRNGKYTGYMYSYIIHLNGLQHYKNWLIYSFSYQKMFNEFQNTSRSILLSLTEYVKDYA